MASLGRTRSCDTGVHENHDCQRCVAPADQWRRDARSRRPQRGWAASAMRCAWSPRGTFAPFPVRRYPEIRLAVFPYRTMAQRIRAFQPHALHIATEGPLGTGGTSLLPDATGCASPPPITRSFRSTCARGCRFRYGSPTRRCAGFTARPSLHGQHPTVPAKLGRRGFRNLVRWQRGRRYRSCSGRGPRSSWICRGRSPPTSGRLAVEKNIDAFLQMPWAGSKLVIGDGPERARLEAQYPDGASPAIASARIWRRTWRPPTSWCSRAAPTPSAW